MPADGEAQRVSSLRELVSAELTGSLTLTSKNHEIKVNAKADKLIVNLPDDYALKVTSLSSVLKVHRQSLATMHQVFVAAGVGAEFVYRGRTVASLGKNSRPSYISRILKLDPFSVKLLPALSSLLSGKAKAIEERIKKQE